MAFAVRSHVFVIKRVFAGDEGGLVMERSIVAALRSPNKRTEYLRAVGITPTEIVEDGDAVWIASYYYCVPNCFINGRNG